MQVFAANLLVFKKNKLLSVKRSKTDIIFGGMWALPGGQIENTESPHETIKREVLEETGLHVSRVSDDPVLATDMRFGKYELNLKIFTGGVKDGNLSPKDSDIEEVGWIKPQQLIDSLKKHKFPEKETAMLEKLFEKFPK